MWTYGEAALLSENLTPVVRGPVFNEKQTSLDEFVERCGRNCERWRERRTISKIKTVSGFQCSTFFSTCLFYCLPRGKVLHVFLHFNFILIKEPSFPPLGIYLLLLFFIARSWKASKQRLKSISRRDKIFMDIVCFFPWILTAATRGRLRSRRGGMWDVGCGECVVLACLLLFVCTSNGLCLHLSVINSAFSQVYWKSTLDVAGLMYRKVMNLCGSAEPSDI